MTCVVTLQSILPAPSPMTLQLLDCNGCRLDLHSLEGCPPTVQTLDCNNTRVAELGPLTACVAWRTLDCSNTKVVHELNCCLYGHSHIQWQRRWQRWAAWQHA